MTARSVFVFFVSSLSFAVSVPANAELSGEQIYSIFSQANEAFRQANLTADNPAQAKKLYEKAILAYERIINDGEVENAKLYYNLANAYFLKEDIGKAILNYRRAEKLDSADANLRKNLDFARSKRIDKIKPRAEKRVLQTLFFWHYDFSLKTKFVLTCFFFATICGSLTVMVWFGRAASSTVTAIIAALLMICVLSSVILEAGYRASSVGGVITADEVVARQGDGQNYPASFKAPLHAGTEYDLLERRPGWYHIRLFDDSDGWIPDHSADSI